MPRNILEVILSISEDKTFPPSRNLSQIGRIAKGFAPMLTEILEDYVGQNAGISIALKPRGECSEQNECARSVTMQEPKSANRRRLLSSKMLLYESAADLNYPAGGVYRWNLLD